MIEITIENLSKHYAGKTVVKAVDGVSLDIQAGELFFLLGPSGCGKTTLLRMIAGLAEPTGGRILFGRRDVTREPTERRQAAMVFQNYALWPHMSVQQNVGFGPRMQSLPADQVRQRTVQSLQLVKMDHLAHRKPNELSGGQQQRVALARALAAGGQCLLLDEPLSNLDARLRQHMRGQLRQLVKASGVTAIYVTHDQTEALSMADRIAVMDAGQVVQVDTPQGLYERPATRFVADFLGEANFLTGNVVPCNQPATACAPCTAVETPAGLIRSSTLGFDVGQEVTCCVRPERVEIAAASRQMPAGTCLPAKVQGVTYLGHMHQYACLLSDGQTWRISAVGNAAPYHEGQEVTLTVDPQHVVLLTR